MEDQNRHFQSATIMIFSLTIHIGQLPMMPFISVPTDRLSFGPSYVICFLTYRRRSHDLSVFSSVSGNWEA